MRLTLNVTTPVRIKAMLHAFIVMVKVVVGDPVFLASIVVLSITMDKFLYVLAAEIIIVAIQLGLGIYISATRSHFYSVMNIGYLFVFQTFVACLIGSVLFMAKRFFLKVLHSTKVK